MDGEEQEPVRPTSALSEQLVIWRMAFTHLAIEIIQVE